MERVKQVAGLSWVGSVEAVVAAMLSLLHISEPTRPY